MKINYTIKESLFKVGDKLRVHNLPELLKQVLLDADEELLNTTYTVREVPPGFPTPIDKCTYRYPKNGLICVITDKWAFPVDAVYKV